MISVKVSLEVWPGEEIDAIFQQEFKEVNEFQDVCTGLLDHAQYRKIDKERRLVSVIARAPAPEFSIVGYLIVVVYHPIQNKGMTAALKNMIYVHPDYRRHGVANMMMTMAINECRRRDAKIMYANDKVSKNLSRSLLLAHGFDPWQLTYARKL